MPETNYSGSDSFVVEVSDGLGGTDMITVDVTVNAVNEAPIVTAVTAPDVGTPMPERRPTISR